MQSEETAISRREQLVEAIIEKQNQMFQAMQSRHEPEWMGSDMTMPQFKILLLLYKKGDLRMSEIAHALGKNISTATGVIDRLVEQKFVRREEDPKDRRVVVASLTEPGREVCDSLMRNTQRHMKYLLERLSTEELELVDQATSVVSKVAQEIATEQESFTAPNHN